MRKIIFIILAVLTVSGAKVDVKNTKKILNQIFHNKKPYFSQIKNPKLKADLEEITKQMKDVKNPLEFYKKYLLPKGVSPEIADSSNLVFFNIKKPENLKTINRPNYTPEELAKIPVIEIDFGNLGGSVDKISNFSLSAIPENMQKDIGNIQLLLKDNYEQLKNGFYGNDPKKAFELVEKRYNKFMEQFPNATQYDKISGLAAVMAFVKAETASKSFNKNANIEYYSNIATDKEKEKALVTNLYDNRVAIGAEEDV